MSGTMRIEGDEGSGDQGQRTKDKKQQIKGHATPSEAEWMTYQLRDSSLSYPLSNMMSHS